MSEASYDFDVSPAPRGGPPSDGFWGKYRGIVIDNIDFTMQARLLCEVPALPEMLLNWALPCVPYAGFEVGFFAMPPIGANVWIEFERGNPNYPIWTGCYWEAGQIPLAPELSPEDPSLVKVFRSDFCTLMFNDTPETGGIMLSVIDPAVGVPVTLTMTSAGLEINVAEVNLLMSAEAGITLEVAETVTNMTEASVVTEAPLIDLTAEGDVNVTAATVTVEGDTNVTPALEVEGESNFIGAVEVEGESNFIGAVEVEGGVNIVGAVEVEGGVNIVGALGVEGDANFLGAAQVEGNLAVAGTVEAAFLVGVVI